MRRYVDDDKRLAWLLHLFLQHKAGEEEISEMLFLIRETGGEEAWNQFLADHPEVPWRNGEPSLPPKRRLLNTAVLQLSAILLVHICFCIYLYRSGALPPENVASRIIYQQKTVRRVILPDSSVMILSPGSSVEYPEVFTGAAREVTLNGEAYCVVQAGARHPFVIHSGDIRTTVLGTSFNIRAFAGEPEMQITVCTGKVRVEGKRGELGVLTADKRITINNKTYACTISTSHADKDMQWLAKDLYFRNASMQAVMEVLAARLQIRFRFASAAIAETRVTTMFNGRETPQQMFSILSDISRTSYQLAGNEVIFGGK